MPPVPAGTVDDEVVDEVMVLDARVLVPVVEVLVFEVEEVIW